MLLDSDRIDEIVEEYDCSRAKIIEYYNVLKTYPCVVDSDEDYLYECLEILAREKPSKVFSAVEKCLYRIYQDDALEYLSDKFKKDNNL